MTKRDRNFVFGIFGILLCANVLAWLAVYDLSGSRFLEVNFFDVGQGDSILIETPWRQQILIDGGPSSIILEKLAKEMPFWDRTIDLIILTHPEHDHIAGLIEVLKRYKVENILWTGVVRDTAEYKEWQWLIKEEGAKITISQAGQRVKFHRSDLWQFEVLFPFENLEGRDVKNSNNTSIVIHLTFGQNFFLFTGDIYKSIEDELAIRADLGSDVLKVSHHGSKTSTSKDFLAAVSPDIAIISAGENNSYGHPHPETLATLEEFGIKILRTDINGDIKIISNGISFSHF